MFKRKKPKSKEEPIQSWEEGRKWLKENKWEITLYDHFSLIDNEIRIYAEKNINGLDLKFNANGKDDLKTLQKLISNIKKYNIEVSK